MTLDELLQQAREKSDAATKGPWKSDNLGKDAPYVWDSDDLMVAKTWNEIRTIGAANRDFIAFARTALPLLVKIVEELRGCIEPCSESIALDERIKQLIEKEMKP